jgi:NAD(P)-dependent dehydrogenase (short-subunit alcohol dehydrogenase family)
VAGVQLQGKVALITGAGSGIGRATARLFAAEGAAVAAADIRIGTAEETVSLIRAAGGEAVAIQADVSRRADTAAAVLAVQQAWGRLHILFNNAGVLLPGTVEDLSEEDWDRTLAVNLKSIFLTGKAAVPLLRRSGGGSIINMASSAGLVAEKAIAAYCASKGGVVMLTRQMALDYAREGIRVNCLCPGWIDTPFNDPVIEQSGGREELKHWIDQMVPVGRQGEPAEVARAALFLASDAASLITGHALVIDGGLTIQ